MMYPPASAETPLVTIQGGVLRANRQLYEWTVTNHHSSPIVLIHFPQYSGDTFNTPKGWSQEWKNQAKLGGKDAPGWVKAIAEDAEPGIAPGESAKFDMRLSRGGALARPGKVTVRFADGTEVVVRGVELPSAPSFLERNAMVIGLAAIFVIVLIVHFRRQRKSRTATPPSASSGQPE